MVHLLLFVNLLIIMIINSTNIYFVFSLFLKAGYLNYQIKLIFIKSQYMKAEKFNNHTKINSLFLKAESGKKLNNIQK